MVITWLIIIEVAALPSFGVVDLQVEDGGVFSGKGWPCRKAVR